MGNSSTKALEQQIKLLQDKLKRETDLRNKNQNPMQDQSEVKNAKHENLVQLLNSLEKEKTALKEKVRGLERRLLQQNKQQKQPSTKENTQNFALVVTSQPETESDKLRKELDEARANLKKCMEEIKMLKYMSNKKMQENEKLEVECNDLIAESKKLRDRIEDLRVRNGKIIMDLDAYVKGAKNHAKGAAAKCKAIFEEIHMCMDQFAFICVSGGVYSHEQRLQMDIIRRVLLMVGTLKELFHNCFFGRKEGKSHTNLNDAQVHGVVLEACVDLFGMWDLCNDLFQHESFHINLVLRDSIKDLDDAIKQLKDMVQPWHSFSGEVEGLEKALLKDLLHCKKEWGVSQPKEFSYTVRSGFYMFLKDPEIYAMRDEIKKYVQSVIDAVLPPWEWVVKLGAVRVVSETGDLKCEVKISVVVLSKREKDWSCVDEISSLSKKRQKIEAIKRFMGVNDYEHMHVLLEKYGKKDKDVGVLLYRFLTDGRNDPKLETLHRICVGRLGPREGTLGQVCKILRDLPAQRT